MHKISNPIGLAVLTFIGNKQTDGQAKLRLKKILPQL